MAIAVNVLVKGLRCQFSFVVAKAKAGPLTPLAMHRYLLSGLGTLLLSGSLSLSASAMEPLVISATDQVDDSMVLDAEQAYFTESSDDWSRTVEPNRMPASGIQRNQPPKGYGLMEMSF